MEPNTAHSQGPSAESQRLGYETSDVRFGGLAWFVLGTIVFGVVLWIIIWFIMQMFLHHAQVDDVPRSAIHAAQVPPAPTIQPMHAADVLPSQDLQEMREHEDAVFQQLGWKVDAATHSVQIPADMVAKVRDAESAISGTAPTAGPKNANTINPGPPTTQTTHGAALSPQGPGGNRQNPPYPGSERQ